MAGSALASALGSLLAPFSVARLERHALPRSIAWPALGIGMVAGWAFAAWQPAALLVAQFLSGMCMSALEGDMDARVAAGNASPRGVTASLATAAALRAFGSATAVALAPRLISQTGSEPSASPWSPYSPPPWRSPWPGTAASGPCPTPARRPTPARGCPHLVEGACVLVRG